MKFWFLGLSIKVVEPKSSVLWWHQQTRLPANCACLSNLCGDSHFHHVLWYYVAVSLFYISSSSYKLVDYWDKILQTHHISNSS